MISHIASSVRFARTVVVALVAGAISASTVSLAHAATQDGATSQVSVRYSDLNLATEDGSRALYHRLVNAAEHVCGSRGNFAELRYNRDVQSCVSDTVARVVKNIDHPRFARVAAAQMR